MKMEKKQFNIEGTIEVDVDEDTFNTEFLKWVELRKWSFLGIITQTDDYKVSNFTQQDYETMIDTRDKRILELEMLVDGLRENSNLWKQLAQHYQVTSNT